MAFLQRSIDHSMPHYQIVFRGEHFHVDMEDATIVGFFTTRRAKGADPREAFRVACNSLRNEEKTKALVAESRLSGADPRIEMEEILDLPWWKVLISKCPSGFIFYDNEPENEEVD